MAAPNLLTLPAEIRLNIYSYLFSGVTFKVYCGPNTRSGKSRPLWPPTLYINNDTEYPTLTCVTEYISYPKSCSLFLVCKAFFHDALLWDACLSAATLKVSSTSDVEHLSRSAFGLVRRRLQNNILVTGHMTLPRVYNSLVTSFPSVVKSIHHKAAPCCCWWTYFPHNLLTCDPDFPKRIVKAEYRPCRVPSRIILDHCTPVRGMNVRKPLVRALKKGELRLTVEIEMWLQGGGGDGSSANYIGHFNSDDWILRVKRKDDELSGKVWEIPQTKVWEV